MMILPYVIQGKVVHGKALGRTVGMPTANLSVQKELLPEPGVYATRIRVDEVVYDSVTNIGRRPSVDEEREITVETYILNFHQNIYGKTVELEIHKKIRPVQKFDNLEAVQKQVMKDVSEAEQYFKTM